MTRQDWLILMLGFKGSADSTGLDPVRVQKGMFLVAKEGGVPAAEAYDFMAYNWGPYSRALRADLDRLVAEGMVEARQMPGYSWKRYSLTALGLERARQLVEAAPPSTAHAVAAIKRRVTALSFNRLLDEVYTAYPKYAEKSLFRA